jgi:hypothetical protein
MTGETQFSPASGATMVSARLNIEARVTVLARQNYSAASDVL